MIEHYVDEKGRAAVITSPGYGAGWSTWNYKDMAFDKRIVQWIRNQHFSAEEIDSDRTVYELNVQDLTSFIESLDYKDVYYGGASSLMITFVPRGTLVRITEYDGAEGIEIYDNEGWEVM